MTFVQSLGHADLWSDVPPVESSSGTKLGLVGLSSDVPIVKASSSQEGYYIR